MRRLLILGGGTAGTMVANKLRRALDRRKWEIAVVDRDRDHLYQPGLLLLPFGEYQPAELIRPRESFLPAGVDLLLGEVDRIAADDDRVLLTDGRELAYDYLVVATGATPRPDQTPGMTGWGSWQGTGRCRPSGRWRPGGRWFPA